MMAALATLAIVILCVPPPTEQSNLAWAGLIPPIKVDIKDAGKKLRGQALIYPNFIELKDEGGNLRGAVGVVNVQGRVQLFLVRSNEERKFIGWAENYRLYNLQDKLVGYYYWTPIMSYVYDPKMKKVGEAQCIAYQGVCAAGIAGFLLGLVQ